MKFSQAILTLALFTTTLALPDSRNQLKSRITSPHLYPAAFERRQACAETCGNVCYYQSTINRAVAEGCELYEAGGKSSIGTVSSLRAIDPMLTITLVSRNGRILKLSPHIQQP